VAAADAKVGNRAGIGPLGQRELAHGRRVTSGLVMRHVKVGNREVIDPIAGRSAAGIPVRRARNVSADRIGRAGLAEAGRRDSGTGRDRRAMAIGHGASIDLRAIDRKDRRAIGTVPVRRASPRAGTANDSVHLETAIGLGRPERLGSAIGLGRRGQAIAIGTARVRRAGLGRQVAAVADSGRRVASVPVVLGVRLQGRGRKAAHHDRPAPRGRRATTTVHLASGATTNRASAR
jgi:hypothetical protein